MQFVHAGGRYRQPRLAARVHVEPREIHLLDGLDDTLLHLDEEAERLQLRAHEQALFSNKVAGPNQQNIIDIMHQANAASAPTCTQGAQYDRKHVACRTQAKEKLSPHVLFTLKLKTVQLPLGGVEWDMVITRLEVKFDHPLTRFKQVLKVGDGLVLKWQPG